jgi:hypothetical protein
MTDCRNALIKGLVCVWLAISFLQLPACASRSTQPTASTTYCAELRGIRAVKSIGCKEDNVGQAANTRAPNTNVVTPH